MRLLVTVLAFLALGAAPAIAAADVTATAPVAAVDVTATPVVQRDLALAESFWQVEQPTLAAPCPTEQVMVEPMTDGYGDNGVVVPAANVWAGTVVGQCTIYVSPAMWVAATMGNRADQYSVCIAFAHEYGHTLGLADTEAIPMMGASDWSRRDDPLCAQDVYGWRGSSHPDREWLAANHLARFHFRGLLIRRAHRS
jgi:hypothetical protein